MWGRRELISALPSEYGDPCIPFAHGLQGSFFNPCGPGGKRQRMGRGRRVEERAGPPLPPLSRPSHHPCPRDKQSNSDTLPPGGGGAGVGMGAENVASQSRENDPRHGIPLLNANAGSVTSSAAGGTQACGLLLAALPAPAPAQTALISLVAHVSSIVFLLLIRGNSFKAL